MNRPFLLLLLLMSCGPGPDTTDAALIRGVMEDQQEAWNAGDIPGFMHGYSDTVCFINSKGTTCGRASVERNYLLSYPDKAAMGTLIFGINEVVPVGGEHAWVTGTWTLERTMDTIGGGFSLLWVKEARNWRIARDHTY